MSDDKKPDRAPTFSIRVPLPPVDTAWTQFISDERCVHGFYSGYWGGCRSCPQPAWVEPYLKARAR